MITRIDCQDPLPWPEQRVMFEQMREARAAGLSDEPMRGRLIETNIPLAIDVAGRVVYGPMDEDITQEAFIALAKAVDCFDVTLGWQFSTYAWRVITNTLRRILERRARFYDEHVFGLEADDRMTCPRGEGDVVEQREQLAAVHAAIASGVLDEQQQAVLMDRMSGATLEVAGQRHSKTKEWARKQQNAALRQLREALGVDVVRLPEIGGAA